MKLFSPSEACRIFHFFEKQFSPTFMCFVDDLHSKLLINEEDIHVVTYSALGWYIGNMISF